MTVEDVVSSQARLPESGDALSAKQDIARQLASATTNGEGGILSQLASNPFFTALS